MTVVIQRAADAPKAAPKQTLRVGNPLKEGPTKRLEGESREVATALARLTATKRRPFTDTTFDEFIGADEEQVSTDFGSLTRHPRRHRPKGR